MRSYSTILTKIEHYCKNNVVKGALGFFLGLFFYLRLDSEISGNHSSYNPVNDDITRENNILQLDHDYAYF